MEYVIEKKLAFSIERVFNLSGGCKSEKVTAGVNSWGGVVSKSNNFSSALRIASDLTKGRGCLVGSWGGGNKIISVVHSKKFSDPISLEIQKDHNLNLNAKETKEDTRVGK